MISLTESDDGGTYVSVLRMRSFMTDSERSVRDPKEEVK